jgi:hypothetical protein
MTVGHDIFLIGGGLYSDMISKLQHAPHSGKLLTIVNGLNKSRDEN